MRSSPVDKAEVQRQTRRQGGLGVCVGLRAALGQAGMFPRPRRSSWGSAGSRFGAGSLPCPLHPPPPREAQVRARAWGPRQGCSHSPSFLPASRIHCRPATGPQACPPGEAPTTRLPCVAPRGQTWAVCWEPPRSWLPMSSRSVRGGGGTTSQPRSGGGPRGPPQSTLRTGSRGPDLPGARASFHLSSKDGRASGQDGSRESWRARWPGREPSSGPEPGRTGGDSRGQLGGEGWYGAGPPGEEAWAGARGDIGVLTPPRGPEAAAGSRAVTRDAWWVPPPSTPGPSPWLSHPLVPWG